MKIGVSEIFYSLQGEGPFMGKPSVFIRLGGCNLLCGGTGTDKDKSLHNGATWRCDTIEVWQNSKTRTVEDLLESLNIEGLTNHLDNGAHLIITGGEPLLWQKSLIQFLRLFPVEEIPFTEIETNGTILPDNELDRFVNQYNVSLKLKNSGMEIDQRWIDDSLKFLTESSKAIFKFVVSDETDIIEIREFQHRYNIYSGRIWLMPAAETREQLNRNCKMVAELCKFERMNFSSRLQLNIWDQTTGV